MPADHAERPTLLLGLGKASFYAKATGAVTQGRYQEARAALEHVGGA